jgi:hypothetical protein
MRNGICWHHLLLWRLRSETIKSDDEFADRKSVILNPWIYYGLHGILTNNATKSRVLFANPSGVQREGLGFHVLRLPIEPRCESFGFRICDLAQHKHATFLRDFRLQNLWFLNETRENLKGRTNISTIRLNESLRPFYPLIPMVRRVLASRFLRIGQGFEWYLKKLSIRSSEPESALSIFLMLFQFPTKTHLSNDHAGSSWRRHDRAFHDRGLCWIIAFL